MTSWKPPCCAGVSTCMSWCFFWDAPGRRGTSGGASPHLVNFKRLPLIDVRIAWMWMNKKLNHPFPPQNTHKKTQWSNEFNICSIYRFHRKFVNFWVQTHQVLQSHLAWIRIHAGVTWKLKLLIRIIHNVWLNGWKAVHSKFLEKYVKNTTYDYILVKSKDIIHLNKSL